MNTDKPDNTTAAAAEAVLQAHEAWRAHLDDSNRVLHAALDAIRTASPTTPPEALIADWSRQTAELIRVVTALSRGSLDVMEAYQRLLMRP